MQAAKSALDALYMDVESGSVHSKAPSRSFVCKAHICFLLSTCLVFSMLLLGRRTEFLRFARQQDIELPRVSCYLNFSRLEEQEHTAVVHEPSEIHVAFATDPGNFVGLTNSMLSATWHLRQPGLCTFHVFSRAQHLEEIQRALKCFWNQLGSLPTLPRVRVHTMPSFAETASLRSEVARPELLHPENNVRLHLDELLPNLTRVIWLDLDIIVMRDLQDLYWSLSHGIVAAAAQRLQFKDQFRMKELNRLAQKQYNPLDPVFNAGVMVIDLEKWRANKVRSRVLHWIEMAAKNDITTCCLNQPALNLAIHDDWEALDQRWNFDPYFCDAGHVDDAFIVHFAGERKPWLKHDWAGIIAEKKKRLHWINAKRAHARYAELVSYPANKLDRACFSPLSQRLASKHSMQTNNGTGI